MDDTAISEHLVEALLTLTRSTCLSFHFDKKHLVVISLKPEEIKEPVRQSLDDVLAVKAEKPARIGPKDLAPGLSQGHHGELLNV